MNSTTKTIGVTQDIWIKVRFRSEEQRRAVFSNMNKDNKFSAVPTEVVGMTGSRIVVPEGGGVMVAVGGEEPKPVTGDTVILAGKDYRTTAFPREEILKIANEAYKDQGIPVEEALADIDQLRPQVASTIERQLMGRPVYSVPSQKEYIPGGYADGMHDDEFDPVQLEKGIDVELEHVVKYTDKGNRKKLKDVDIARAKEIAKDHIAEIPDYYDRLDVMEEQAKADGSFVDIDELKKPGQ